MSEKKWYRSQIITEFNNRLAQHYSGFMVMFQDKGHHWLIVPETASVNDRLSAIGFCHNYGVYVREKKLRSEADA